LIETFLSLLQENTAKEKTPVKTTAGDPKREQLVLPVSSGKNHSYRRYFSVKKTMEVRQQKL